jgi:hypothetical protein
MKTKCIVLKIIIITRSSLKNKVLLEYYKLTRANGIDL